VGIQDRFDDSFESTTGPAVLAAKPVAPEETPPTKRLYNSVTNSKGEETTEFDPAGLARAAILINRALARLREQAQRDAEGLPHA
jgi:hypothetical protein